MKWNIFPGIVLILCYAISCNHENNTIKQYEAGEDTASTFEHKVYDSINTIQKIENGSVVSLLSFFQNQLVLWGSGTRIRIENNQNIHDSIETYLYLDSTKDISNPIISINDTDTIKLNVCNLYDEIIPWKNNCPRAFLKILYKTEEEKHTYQNDFQYHYDFVKSYIKRYKKGIKGTSKYLKDTIIVNFHELFDPYIEKLMTRHIVYPYKISFNKCVNSLLASHPLILIEPIYFTFYFISNEDQSKRSHDSFEGLPHERPNYTITEFETDNDNCVNVAFTPNNKGYYYINISNFMPYRGYYDLEETTPLKMFTTNDLLIQVR